MTYCAMLLMIINVIVCRKLDCGSHVTNPVHGCSQVVYFLVRLKRGMIEQVTAFCDSLVASTTLTSAPLPVSTVGC